MVDVRNNFKNKYKDDLGCPMNCGELESQEHLLFCLKLHDEKTQTEDSSYAFIFSFNLEKMKEVKNRGSFIKKSFPNRKYLEQVHT